MNTQPVTRTPNGTPIHTSGNRAAISREDFLKLLVSQIAHQDPLSPMDNNQFLSQMVNIQNLESITTLTGGIQNLLKFQQMGAASALIGKTVLGISDTGLTGAGVVTGVSVRGDDLRLIVGGTTTMALGNVQQILAA